MRDEGRNTRPCLVHPSSLIPHPLSCRIPHPLSCRIPHPLSCRIPHPLSCRIPSGPLGALPVAGHLDQPPQRAAVETLKPLPAVGAVVLGKQVGVVGHVAPVVVFLD